MIGGHSRPHSSEPAPAKSSGPLRTFRTCLRSSFPLGSEEEEAGEMAVGEMAAAGEMEAAGDALRLASSLLLAMVRGKHETSGEDLVGKWTLNTGRIF